MAMERKIRRWIAVVVLFMSFNGASPQQYSPSYPYLNADFTRCQSESPDVLIWVQGRVTSFTVRSMIRETMGNQEHWPHGVKVMLAFIVGKVAEPEPVRYKRFLQDEYQKYRDIVQTDFVEHYQNQTCKLMTAINYIADHCKDLKLVIKMDDDVLFHPKLMLDKLVDLMMKKDELAKTRYPVSSKLRALQPKTLACNLLVDQLIGRNNRTFYSQPDRVLRGEKYFPPFCAGFFVVMSGDVPSLFKPHIIREETFWIDDSYMGVLQRHAETNHINIASTLDYGYSDFDGKSVKQFVSQETIARHLPDNLQFHMADIFNYLALFAKSTSDVPAFKTIPYTGKGDNKNLGRGLLCIPTIVSRWPSPIFIVSLAFLLMLITFKVTVMSRYVCSPLRKLLGKIC